MTGYKSAALALAMLTLGALPVGAQDARNVEITPYVGLGTAGASPFGAAVTFPVGPKLNLETDIAYRQGEGDIHALSTNISLLYLLPNLGRSTPYVAGGVGLSQIGVPVFASPGPPSGTEKSLAFTVNAGGGVNASINDKVGLRTDARWFKSFGNHGSEQFRVAQGVSFNAGRR